MSKLVALWPGRARLTHGAWPSTAANILATKRTVCRKASGYRMPPPDEPPTAVPPELREALGAAYDLAQRLSRTLQKLRANAGGDPQIERWLAAQRDLLELTTGDVFARWVMGRLTAADASEALRAAVRLARASKPGG